MQHISTGTTAHLLDNALIPQRIPRPFGTHMDDRKFRECAGLATSAYLKRPRRPFFLARLESMLSRAKHKGFDIGKSQA